MFVLQVIDDDLPSIVKNYSGLLATRFCLGLAEAGVFPGSTVDSSSDTSITDDEM